MAVAVFVLTGAQCVIVERCRGSASVERSYWSTLLMDLLQITITNIPKLGFLQAGRPSCRPNNSAKALKAML